MLNWECPWQKCVENTASASRPSTAGASNTEDWKREVLVLSSKSDLSSLVRDDTHPSADRDNGPDQAVA